MRGPKCASGADDCDDGVEALARSSRANNIHELASLAEMMPALRVAEGGLTRSMASEPNSRRFISKIADDDDETTSTRGSIQYFEVSG